MEAEDWNRLVDDDEEEVSCLSREECIQELLRDAPAGCLYCRLSEVGEEDDD